MLKAGFSRVQVTPPLGIPMAGHPGTKLAAGVLDDLHARALVIDDGQTVAALASVDVICLTADSVARIRKTASECGIPEHHIFIHATHTHSGPLTTGLFGAADDVSGSYLFSLEAGIAKAIREAYASVLPVRCGINRGEVSDLSFNARFLMRGGRVETHPFKSDPEILRPEGPVDPEMLVLCVRDMGGGMSGVLVNWGNHPQVMERQNPNLSADFPGWMEKYAREKAAGDPVAVFVNGACGNLCPVDAQSTKNIEVGPEWAQHIGKTLATKSLTACETAVLADDLSIQARTVNLVIPLRDIPDKLVAESKRFLSQNEGAEFEPVLVSNWGIETGTDREKYLSLEQYLGTPSWKDQEARDVLALADQKHCRPVEECELSIVALGDLAIVMLPFELFVELGLEIKSRSPYAYTMIVELANGYSGYVPTTRAFSRPGGYETLTLTSSKLVEIAGEMVVEETICLLNEMKSIRS